MESHADVVVVGGGPAGLTAARAASERGKETVLVERNERVGKKMLISGGGRCNLTNLCDVEEFLERIPFNREFLYSALYTMTPQAVVDMVEDGGVPTKVEDRGRVFPVSDRSSDVVDLLVRKAEEAGVDRRIGRARGLLVEDGSIRSVVLENGDIIQTRSCIIATGGMTYPSTGSSGDGYDIARMVGHRVIDPVPRLRPLKARSPFFKGLQGNTLEDVGVIIHGSPLSRGSVMITHGGLSGPAVFDLDLNSGITLPVEGELNLMPSFDNSWTESDLVKRMEKAPKKMVANVLMDLFPRRVCSRICEMAGIPHETTSSQLRKDLRRSLVSVLRSVPVIFTGWDDEKGMVTSGGVDVKEVDPGTMASKKVEGLLFAGEVLDIHGPTGGYNIQIALSTGNLAGENC